MIHAGTEKNPSVLVGNGRTEYGVEAVTYKGQLIRVYPVTSRDVFGIQMLDHRREKFAPEKGGGVFLTPEALAKLQA